MRNETMYVKGLHELSSTQTGGPVQSSQAVILVRSQTSEGGGTEEETPNFSAGRSQDPERQ